MAEDDPATAQRYFIEALDIARTLEPVLRDTLLPWWLFHCADAARRLRQYDRALPLYQDCLAALAAQPQRFQKITMSFAYSGIGETALAAGDYPLARTCFLKSLALRMECLEDNLWDFDSKAISSLRRGIRPAGIRATTVYARRDLPWCCECPHPGR